MFKEIKDEKAFDGILNQIIDNIQNGHLKAGDALPDRKNDGRDDGSIQTGGTGSLKST